MSVSIRTCLTAASIGVIAMAAADMVHEVLGHGTACLLTGNRILSLSTVALQTAAPGRIVSAAGTVANCLVGGASLLLVARRKRWSSATSFWYVFGLFNLFNSGYLVASAVTGNGDWANVISGLPASGLLRILMATVGIVLYIQSVRFATRLLLQRAADGQVNARDLPQLTLPAYASAGVLMTLAACFNPIGPQLILGSGVAASFGLNAGLLFIPAIVDKHASPPTGTAPPLPASLPWIAAALVIGGLFVALLGPGVHFGS